MGSLDRQRWDALWQRLGGNPPADAFDALLAAYGGADRHYHSDRHILACLEHFDRWRQLALRPDLVELALWTHDLVYDTQRQGQRGRQRRQHRALARPGRAGGAAAGPARTDHGHLSPGAAGRRRRSPGGGYRPRHPRRAGAGLRALRGGRPRRIRLGAGTAVPRRARQVAAPVAGATGAVPLRTAAATLGRPPPAPTCAVPWSAWNSRPEPHGKISSRRLTRLSPHLRLRQQEGTARTGSSPLHPPKEEIS